MRARRSCHPPTVPRQTAQCGRALLRHAARSGRGHRNAPRGVMAACVARSSGQRCSGAACAQALRLWGAHIPAAEDGGARHDVLEPAWRDLPCCRAGRRRRGHAAAVAASAGCIPVAGAAGARPFCLPVRCPPLEGERGQGRRAVGARGGVRVRGAGDECAPVLALPAGQMHAAGDEAVQAGVHHGAYPPPHDSSRRPLGGARARDALRLRAGRPRRLSASRARALDVRVRRTRTRRRSLVRPAHSRNGMRAYKSACAPRSGRSAQLARGRVHPGALAVAAGVPLRRRQQSAADILGRPCDHLRQRGRCHRHVPTVAVPRSASDYVCCAAYIAQQRR